MKNFFNRSTAITLVVFLLAGSAALLLGFYRSTLNDERASFKIDLPVPGNKEVVLDLSKMGTPKQLVQPGLVSISSGHGGGITNKTDKPMEVKVTVEGFPGHVSLHCTSLGLDEATGLVQKPLMPGKQMDLSLDVEVPKEYREKGFLGKVHFVDVKSGQDLGVLPIKIVNSEAPVAQEAQPKTEDCCETTPKDAQGGTK